MSQYGKRTETPTIVSISCSSSQLWGGTVDFTKRCADDHIKKSPPEPPRIRRHRPYFRRLPLKSPTKGSHNISKAGHHLINPKPFFKSFKEFWGHLHDPKFIICAAGGNEPSGDTQLCVNHLGHSKYGGMRGDGGKQRKKYKSSWGRRN